MRALLALLLAGLLAAPALAHPRHGCRHDDGRGFHRYHHWYRYHAPRFCAAPHVYGYYPDACWSGPYYGGYRYFRPVLRFGHVYTRLAVSLTLDDAAFDGPAADLDGVPQPRTGPVGARFLVDSP